MKFTKILLASASSFFLINQGLVAMEKDTGLFAGFKKGFFTVREEPAANQPIAPTTPGAMKTSSNAAPGILNEGIRGNEQNRPQHDVTGAERVRDKKASVSTTPLTSEIGVDQTITTAASVTASHTNPAWTLERIQWIFNAITQPGQFQCKISGNHPEKDFIDLGIEAALQTKEDPISRRNEVARRFFEEVVLNDSQVAALKHPKCPVETVLAFLAWLTERSEHARVRAFFDSFSHSTELSALDFYRGSCRYFQGNDASLEAEPYYSRFLQWYAQYKSTAIGKLFSQHQLAEANGCIGLACQRIPTRIPEVYNFLKTAYTLRSSSLAHAYNFADWCDAIQKGEEAALVRAAAKSLEYKSGRTSSVANVVPVLSFPTGKILPLGSVPSKNASQLREDDVRKEAHRKIDEDTDFADQVALGMVQVYARLTPTQFAALSDARDTLYWDIHTLNQKDVVKSENVAPTLQRIKERLSVVPLDLDICQQLSKLRTKFSNTIHGQIITSLQAELRRVITNSARQNEKKYLGCAHMSGIPGLAEEVAFLKLQSTSQESLRPITVGVNDKLHTLNPLHMQLSTENPLPRNALQTLSINGISPESDLYRYWQQKWDETYGTQQREAWQAMLRELKEAHITAWSSIPTVTHQPGAKNARTGPKQHVSNDDDDDTTASSLSSSGTEDNSYDSAAITHEAWRRSREPEYKIPDDVMPSLRLGVTSSARGGSRSEVTLWRTLAGIGSEKAREESLASFHPHQLHASDRKAGEEISQETLMTMLWNLYSLQRDAKKS